MAHSSLTPEGFLADQPVEPPEVSDLHRGHLLFVSYPPRPGNRTGISLTPERPQGAFLVQPQRQNGLPMVQIMVRTTFFVTLEETD